MAARYSELIDASLGTVNHRPQPRSAIPQATSWSKSLVFSL